MIVMDASAAVAGLLHDADARGPLVAEEVAIPYLADSEVVHTLRRLVRRKEIEEQQGRVALELWSLLEMRRFGAVLMLGRIWELRHNLTAYDATYVALAESLECELVTADARIAGAPGPTCAITVVGG